MKTLLIAVCATILFGMLPATAQPRIITIIQTSANQTNTVNIADFEYVKVLSLRDFANNSTLAVSTSGANIVYGPNSPGGINASLGLVIAGPAQVTIRTGNSRFASDPLFVTMEIGPTAYPVTNSVTLGLGQGAEVNLESSTNLVQWTGTTNGLYTAEQAMFFRLHLRRVQ